jgi:predicted metal-dependent phosphoesterase TrpH
MGLSDLHIHSIYSHDGTASVRAILRRSAEIGLNVIAVADHDAMGAVPEAVELAPTYGLAVIPACEISTLDGHLVALFIRRRIPPWLTLAETLKHVAGQGGLCFAAHPGGRYDYSLKLDLVCRTLEDPELARILVGIEAFNAGLLHLADNRGATALARDLPVARLGNSDAHILRMIGTGTTWFQGTTAGDLRRALENRSTEEVVYRPRPRALVVAEWGARLIVRHARSLAGVPYPEVQWVGRHPGRYSFQPDAEPALPIPPRNPEGDARPPAGDD